MAETAEQLFERHFLPLYPPDARADLARARATDANPAQNPAILAQIDEAAAIFARLAPAALGAPELLLDLTDASIHRLSPLLTRERRDAWLAPPSPGEPPLLVTLVTHGAFYLGATIVREHGGTWQVRRPLWESTVRLVSPAGTGDLAVFHWWLKALSDDEVGAGRLGDRYRTHVEVPTFDAARLPVIAPPDRRLPRLAKVRYDLLHKHLRAHLPELRDLGADFPSPERFDEMGFKHLDLTLLGGGRMLLMHGAAAQGLHLFWLDATGFAKAAFFPADAFPAPMVQVEGDKLRVILRVSAREVVHEMLWWGPEPGMRPPMPGVLLGSRLFGRRLLGLRRDLPIGVGAAQVADLVLGDHAPVVGARTGVALADDGVGAAAVLAHLSAGVGHGGLAIAVEPEDAARGGAGDDHGGAAARREPQRRQQPEHGSGAGHRGVDSRRRGAPCQAPSRDGLQARPVTR